MYGLLFEDNTVFNKELLVYNALFILRGYSLKETSLKRNLGSPVKNYPKVSLIYLSESVIGLILIDCDTV